MPGKVVEGSLTNVIHSRDGWQVRDFFSCTLEVGLSAFGWDYRLARSRNFPGEWFGLRGVDKLPRRILEILTGFWGSN